MIDKKKAEKWLINEGFKPQSNVFNRIWIYEKTEKNGEKVVIDLNTFENDYHKEIAEFKKKRDIKKNEQLKQFAKFMHIPK